MPIIVLLHRTKYNAEAGHSKFCKRYLKPPMKNLRFEQSGLKWKWWHKSIFAIFFLREECFCYLSVTVEMFACLTFKYNTFTNFCKWLLDTFNTKNVMNSICTHLIYYYDVWNNNIEIKCIVLKQYIIMQKGYISVELPNI